MKNIFTFGRKPAQRNYAVADVIALMGLGKRLTMCNPATEAEFKACVEAGIDLLTVWDVHLDMTRQIAPTHFAGTAMNRGQFATNDEILRRAIGCMEAGADMYFTNRSLMWSTCWRVKVPRAGEFGPRAVAVALGGWPTRFWPSGG